MRNPKVEALIAGYEAPIAERLLEIREMIFEIAEDHPEVGAIEETTKWGQASYLTPETGAGTTIRIDRVKGESVKCALFFHCQTSVVETCRAHYPDLFEYSGNRAVIFPATGPLPQEALRHCIALGLTYHLNKKAK